MTASSMSRRPSSPRPERGSAPHKPRSDAFGRVVTQPDDLVVVVDMNDFRNVGSSFLSHLCVSDENDRVILINEMCRPTVDAYDARARSPASV